MMFEFPHLNIMSKNTKLSGVPVICQLFSFIPEEIIKEAVSNHKSDRYYKTMTTRKQLAFLLYGIITRVNSLQSLCKSLLFLEDKLMYIGIDKLPPPSTLSDANINRKSDVFGEIYQQLLSHYHDLLFESDVSLPVNGEVDPADVRLFDATTITLFVDIFKAAGRPPLTGKQKGGLKVQAQMPLTGTVPDLIRISEASSNDKNFLGQLNPSPGTIYVFDKGYLSYFTYDRWTKDSVYYVTRLNENASYTIHESVVYDVTQYATGGVMRDEVVEFTLRGQKNGLKARLITYRDPLTGETLQFVSNMFHHKAETIPQLYRYRWNMEILFKRLKSNFELTYFYSDSPEGIKTQIWVVLIAHLLFSVIHKMVKEAEQFTTLVAMASNNLGSYICFVSLIKARAKLSRMQRDLKIIQLEMFKLKIGGDFQNIGKSP